MRNPICDNRGMSGVEYAVIAAFILLGSYAALSSAGSWTALTYCSVGNLFKVNNESAECKRLALKTYVPVTPDMFSSTQSIIGSYKDIVAFGQVYGFYDENGNSLTSIDQLETYQASGHPLYMSKSDNAIEMSFSPPWGNGTHSIISVFRSDGSYGGAFISDRGDEAANKKV